MKNQITKPTLIVDEKNCKQKIAAMLEKAKRNNVDFRPHFKTHQSIEIGRWFRELGTQKITVSSISMATYFASDSWDDITVAFPVNWLEIDTINEISKKIKLNLLVESIETIQFLESHLKSGVGIFIKIDTGYHRTGVSSKNISMIGQLIQEVNKSESLKFLGFLTHSGHTYKTNSIQEIKEIHDHSLQELKKLKVAFHSDEHPVFISIGDTPSISLMEEFEGVDEIRLGNFIFYDLVQEQLGACTFKDISVVLACPIVAKHPERNKVVIYGGGVHLSKEFITDKNGRKIFGRMLKLNDYGWTEPLDNCYLSSVSQEHGILNAPRDILNALKIGEVIGILPVHSCMTADLQHSYLNLNGNKIPNHRN